MANGHETTGNKDSNEGHRRPAFFPYRGGKYRLAPQLAELLPPHKIYVEVFGGAGSVLLAKVPSKVEVYNDANGQLVNLFETVRNHPLLFLERCQSLLYSRELYDTWKDQLAQNFEGSDVDRIDAAVRTAYTITSGFSGDPTKGWAFDRTGGGGSNRWASIWDKIRFVSERLQRVNIDHLDFRKCIEYWDTEDTLFFLDPPYFVSETRFFQFSWQDHLDLQEILQSVKGRWLLTYDDRGEIRELYTKYPIRRISTSLSADKVENGAKRRRFEQLLIANFSLNS